MHADRIESINLKESPLSNETPKSYSLIGDSHKDTNEESHVGSGFSRAYVYLISEVELLEALSLQYALSLLELNEIETYKKIKVGARQREFVLSRAFSKLMLASFSGCDVDNIRLTKMDSFGKPVFKDASSLLKFNLSHSFGMIALCVCYGYEVGVDLEREDPSMKPYMGQIINRNFSAIEANYAGNLSGSELTHYFYKLWTIKEASLKSLGIGLNLPMKKIDTSVLAEKGFIKAKYKSETCNLYPRHWYDVCNGFHLAVTSVNQPLSLSFFKGEYVKRVLKDLLVKEESLCS